MYTLPQGILATHRLRKSMSIYIAMCIYWKIRNIAEVFNCVGTRWEMCLLPHRLKTIYGYKMRKNCWFRHYFHLHPHALCIWLVANLGGRGPKWNSAVGPFHLQLILLVALSQSGVLITWCKRWISLKKCVLTVIIPEAVCCNIKSRTFFSICCTMNKMFSSDQL